MTRREDEDEARQEEEGAGEETSLLGLSQIQSSRNRSRVSFTMDNLMIFDKNFIFYEIGYLLSIIDWTAQRNSLMHH